MVRRSLILLLLTSCFLLLSPESNAQLVYVSKFAYWMSQTAAKDSVIDWIDEYGGSGTFSGDMDDIPDGTTYVKTHNDFTDAAETKLSTIPTLGTAAEKNIPATGDASATEVVYGTDTRLTNARTPSAHTHTESEITDLDHTDVNAIHNETNGLTNILSDIGIPGEEDYILIEEATGDLAVFSVGNMPISAATQTALDGKANSLGADDNYVTDAEKIVIGNTSGTNSGDNATNTQYSGLVGFTDELAQDAVGAMADANTLNYIDGTPLLEVKNQMSITDDASGLKLSGDATSPGNSMLYGTNGSGTKGWYAQPGGAPTGVLDDLQISILQGDGNLAEASGVQTWAGSDRTTQDVFTVTANTTYIVEGRYYINTGSTTHTTALAWSTGATITDFQYQVVLWSAAANTITTTQSTTHVSGVASKVINATSTAVYTIIQFKGTIVVGSTAGGSTITPQINFSANPTGSCLMKRGSWISFTKIGTDTDILKGGWN